MSATVKAGYKQTEVGVIPEDWEISTLSALSKEPMQNGVFYKPSLKGVGVKLINVGDLYTRAPIDSEALELFDATEKERERFKVADGDMFFTRSSVVPSGIAYCNIYRSTKYEPVVFDSHVIRLRPDDRKIVPSYLFRFCLASAARRYFVSHAKTGSMTTIDQGVLGKCPVSLPPKAEQEAISVALSDADTLIESLKQIIAKKRHLKQGAMQELLTGKRRLPGFQVKTGYKKTDLGLIPQDWDVVPMGQIGECLIGLTYSPLDVRNFGTLVLRSSNVQNGRLAFNDNVFVDMEVPTRAITRKNDILICVRNGSRQLIGKCALIDDKAAGSAFGAFMSVLRSDSAEFLFYQFQSNIQKRQIDEVMGATINQITNKDMAAFKVLWPPTKTEQTAIATILSDMDAEIAALETKLAKARSLKQGMMHNLLTGKVRLL